MQITTKKLILAGVLGTALGVGGAVATPAPAAADCYSWSLGPDYDCSSCSGGNGPSCSIQVNGYGYSHCESSSGPCW